MLYPAEAPSLALMVSRRKFYSRVWRECKLFTGPLPCWPDPSCFSNRCCSGRQSDRQRL